MLKEKKAKTSKSPHIRGLCCGRGVGEVARQDIAPPLKRYPLDNPVWKDWLKSGPRAEVSVGDWHFNGEGFGNPCASFI